MDASYYDEDLTYQTNRVDSCETAPEYADHAGGCEYDGSQAMEAASMTPI